MHSCCFSFLALGLNRGKYLNFFVLFKFVFILCRIILKRLNIPRTFSIFFFFSIRVLGLFVYGIELISNCLWCPTLVGEENTSPLIRVWKPSPSRRVWGESERESPKRTISASGGPRSLQMILEPNIRQCASLLAVPRRG